MRAAGSLQEARDDRDRIARALHLAFRERGFPVPEVAYLMENVVTELLLRDVIRVGHRPEKGPEPMRGQLEIQDR